MATRVFKGFQGEVRFGLIEVKGAWNPRPHIPAGCVAAANNFEDRKYEVKINRRHVMTSPRIMLYYSTYRYDDIGKILREDVSMNIGP